MAKWLFHQFGMEAIATRVEAMFLRLNAHGGFLDWIKDMPWSQHVMFKSLNSLYVGPDVAHI